MIWPFKRKDPEPALEPPPPWAGYTPTADMVEIMIGADWPADQMIWALRCIEMRRRIAELGQRVTELETALAHARNTSAMPDKLRITKPRVVTRNAVTRLPRPKKRNRANYMRDYRNRLKLVTRDGDAA